MRALTKNDPGLSPAEEQQFREIYEEYFGMLAGISTSKFAVPDSEAETLAHEVFVTMLRKYDQILDLHSWLVGAICHASRHYWRLNGRIVPVESEVELDRIDPRSTRILDSLPDQIAARQALECLSTRCQEILRLRYFEGCTIPEVAERLGVKPKYAAKLVTKCLRRAEKTYGAKGKKP